MGETARCACGARVRVRFGTDGHGRLVEILDERHRCSPSAVAAKPAVRVPGRCVDCGSEVRGKSLRCEDHKRERRRVTTAESEQRTAAERRRRQRRYDRRKKRRARKNELRRARHSAMTPEQRKAYRERRQRETLASYPGRAKYLEYHRQYNSDPARQQRKRDQALRKYYELHPTRPRPVCATCNETIPWEAGKGRPPKYHPTKACNPSYASLLYLQRKRERARQEQA